MSESYKPLIIRATTDYIPSVNQMFVGRSKHLSPVARQYKEDLLRALCNININLVEVYPYLTPDWSFDVEFQFLLNQNFFKRDTDNMNKFTQDVIFGDWLEINDSSIIRVSAIKYFVPSSPKEQIIAIIKPTEVDVDYYERLYKEQLKSIGK